MWVCVCHCEVDGKFAAAHALCGVPYVHNPRVHGIFYGLGLDRDPIKRLQIRRPKERNMDLHAACFVN